MTSTIPTEDELRQSLVALKSENPSLGIPKLHALLVVAHPDWTVSEKRTRKILQSAGLTNAPASKRQYPSSQIIKDLDIAKWTAKVEVKDFGRQKGKGLVAKERIEEVEVVWKEDPFVLAPEWELYDLQATSRACTYCSTPLTDKPMAVDCPSSTSSSYCPARFCNRLCLSRSGATHSLLCPSRNPAAVPLINFARQMQWQTLHSLAQCTARLLLAWQQGEEAFENDWRIVQGLAVLGMEERFADLARSKGVEPDRATWKKAHQLFVHAFQDPPTEQAKKKLSKILRKPLREDVAKELFEYDGFLRGLGRMNLNQETHGGIYVLHSHLNHSCRPNISVRHLDQRTALSRITVLAKAPIEPGEELVVSYVDPEMSVKERRRQLQQWGFGACGCEKCVEEEKGLPGDEKGDELDGLASELKAGFGVGSLA
ncbi:SET domain-containing protein [Gloeophyllum trabeum ATCC 11539]|uniref:Histone-lysine N-methyltransferase SET5 n=1 Tax=Gloeophyllum trabeum (strain ATCC 11539 / FP-39264 / Madison 617) TaxID=670483 RepID=S7Q7D6_GLOTA|nr:SET domain-containing protein [Gloeophyllum trabeum ATCC 11539]EPQ55921.1 SET domain-containing protein [Gloeophyllum trabeum ATCC 11539]